MNLGNKSKGLALAAAAAAVFALAPIAQSQASEPTKNVKCFGVNACSGKSSCKSAAHACKGENSCKGQGFVEVSKDACQQLGGQTDDPGNNGK